MEHPSNDHEDNSILHKNSYKQSDKKGHPFLSLKSMETETTWSKIPNGGKVTVCCSAKIGLPDLMIDVNVSKDKYIGR